MQRQVYVYKESKSVDPIKDVLPSSAELLFKRLRFRHQAAYFHSLRVAGLSREIAREFGLSQRETNKLTASAALHEAGILETGEEYDIPLASMRIVEQWGLEEAVDKNAILQQAENLDGTGFPNGLLWRDISLSAKMVRVADSFDRMTVSPLGTPLIPASKALDELYRWSDILFDGEVISGLKKVLVYS